MWAGYLCSPEEVCVSTVVVLVLFWQLDYKEISSPPLLSFCLCLSLISFTESTELKGFQEKKKPIYQFFNPRQAVLWQLPSW